MRYLFRILLSMDYLLNAVFDGPPGQSLSVRAWTARVDGRRWGCWLCWTLERAWSRYIGFGPGHCDDAAKSEIVRLQYTLDQIVMHQSKLG